MTDTEAADPTVNSTRWSRRKDTPLARFLATESGSSAILVAATVVALVWANVHASSYLSFWSTQLSITLGHVGVGMDLREWVNAGLMTFFFFVVGLEARRELDLGDLRERRRVTLPVLAGLIGMLIPVLIYLAINGGNGSARGWGAVMSTDTAFAIGILTLLGPRSSERLRSFLLTVVIVDDLAALLVISIAYTESLQVRALLVGLLLFAVVLLLRSASLRVGAVYVVLAIAIWVALLKSGVDPIVVGLAMGLLTYAYPATRTDLERASDLFRRFREQPTSELAASAREGLASAISPNERLQQMFHPWTSYVIVPLFALCNAGVVINGDSLSRALTSPITVGIVVGYVVGKPLGIIGTSWLITTLSKGRLRPPVGWGAVDRGRDSGRRRLHGGSADRDAGVLRGALAGSQDRRAGRRDPRVVRHLAGVPADRPDAHQASGACAGRSGRRRGGPGRAGGRGGRPHARAARRAGHGGRVRRLRVPLLRSG